MSMSSTYIRMRMEDQQFEEWMQELDKLILSATGTSIHDLPDMLFRDAFDAGTTVEEFAEENLGYSQNDDNFDYNILSLLIFLRSAGVNGSTTDS